MCPHVTLPGTMACFEVFTFPLITVGVTPFMVASELVILIVPALLISTGVVIFGDSEVFGVRGFVTNDHQNINI